MYEQENTPATQGDQPQPVPREMLEARIQELISEQQQLQKVADNWMARYVAIGDKLDKAKELIDSVLDSADEPEELFELFKEPFELLGVTMTEEVEVTVTATWTVSVIKPKGHPLSEYDFSASLELDNNELEEAGYFGTPEIEVEESRW